MTKNLSNSSLSKYPEINSQLKGRLHKFSCLLLESVGDSILLRGPFFNKIVKIEYILLQAAILVSNVSRGWASGFCSGGGRQAVPHPLSRFDTLPKARLRAFETKMAACKGRCSKNMGLWRVSNPYVF